MNCRHRGANDVTKSQAYFAFAYWWLHYPIGGLIMPIGGLNRGK
jgi:hypothetical protein